MQFCVFCINADKKNKLIFKRGQSVRIFFVILPPQKKKRIIRKKDRNEKRVDSVRGR